MLASVLANFHPTRVISVVEVEADIASWGAQALIHRNLQVLHGDGGQRISERPDGLICTVSVQGVPEPWFLSLMEGAVLVVPLDVNGLDCLVVLVKSGNRMEGSVARVDGRFSAGLRTLRYGEAPIGHARFRRTHSLSRWDLASRHLYNLVFYLCAVEGHCRLEPIVGEPNHVNGYTLRDANTARSLATLNFASGTVQFRRSDHTTLQKLVEPWSELASPTFRQFRVEVVRKKGLAPSLPSFIYRTINA